MPRTASRAAAAVIVAAASAGVTSGPSSADPSGHQVTYRVTAASEIYAHIAFMAHQPSNEMDYADDSPKYLYTFMPKVNQDAPWSYTTTLANPDRWAYLIAGYYYAGNGKIPTPPEVLAIDPGFRCEIEVDGHVVHKQQGGRQTACGTLPISHIEPGSQIQTG